MEWAHQVAANYSDGQRFLDLHGHHEQLGPMSVVNALAWLPRSLGAQRIPVDLDEQSSLLRSLTVMLAKLDRRPFRRGRAEAVWLKTHLRLNDLQVHMRSARAAACIDSRPRPSPPVSAAACGIIAVMRRLGTTAMLAASMLVLAGCAVGGSVVSSPPASLTSAAAGPSVTRCPDPGVELIVRYKVLGRAAFARRLRSYCGSTAKQISSTAPTADGFCTWMAPATDNPGYEDGATPAAPLRDVTAAIGGGC